MPASRRHHRTLAVLVNCLGVIAAVPALPPAAPRAEAATTRPAPPPAAVAAPARPATAATPIPTGVPAVPPAVPTTGPAPVQPTMPPVSVAVGAAGTPAPGYRIEVRNAGTAPVETMVRQELPSGSRATTVTGGGQVGGPVGATAGEVTWRLRLPARSTTALHTALAVTGPSRSVTAPTCVYGTDGTRPYDCATATWVGAATAPAAQATAAPAWRRPPVLLAAFAAVLMVVGGVLWWAARRRRQRARSAPAGVARAGAGPTGPTSAAGTGPSGAGGAPVAAGVGGPDDRGTIYPRPALPTPASRRRRPPVWLAVGVAAAVLAGVVGAAAWTATQRVAAMDTTKQPTSGAWVGSTVNGGLGVPLRETAFEFTVYRMSCGAGVVPAAPGGGQPCLATVGVRNVTSEQQTWHGQLQRAYLPSGNWVAADENATRVANLGRDVFAQPVAAGRRVLLPLVFTVHGAQPPKQLELRSGVFSAGVRVDVD
ncbi:hypothetical protein O7598_22975 [Micromonospora sp. WMMC241]|uniref:hypothetical protein n=1 Tax=Micromonospora sp. WMMC241 TaxID=3015159 RepID=UPI0022B668CD|nr:hypothetical protein [Micromonospora sp. WMMC241]MCZ7439287.1 hypothetical protein [Micromonospora sp. WMMC241]